MQQRPVVLLIHGTFSASNNDEGPGWWQRGSDFHRFLSKELGSGVDCQPCGHIVHWGGENSETARRCAGDGLFRQIKRYEEQGIPYSIVAHSHGGSVAWYALTAAFSHSRALPHLRAWITIGTPFLQYAANRVKLWLLAPLLTALSALFFLAPTVWQVYQGNFADFTFYPEARYGLIVPGLSLLLLALVTYLSYHIVRCGVTMFRERQLQRIRATCLAHIADRYLPLVSMNDEAINALAGSLGFSGEIVPRVKKPLMWLYNRFLAEAGDQFIWGQLSRQTQGSDLPGLVLSAVLTLPLPVDCGNPISLDLEVDLEARANRQIQACASDLRRALQTVAYNAYPIDYIRSVAVTSEANHSLIHTSYFEHPDVQQLIAWHLICDPSRASGTTPRIPLPTSDPCHKQPFALQLLSSVVSILAVVWITMTIADLVTPLTPQVLISQSARQIPFGLAAYESTYWRRDRPYQFLTLLSRNGMDALAKDLMGRHLDDSSSAFYRALASIASGLLADGRIAAAQPLLDQALINVRIRKEMPKGQMGPEEPVDESALYLASALAQGGRFTDLESILARPASHAEPERSKIFEALISGLVQSHTLLRIPSYLARITEARIQLRAFENFLKARPPIELVQGTIGQLHPENREEAMATMIHVFAPTVDPNGLMPLLNNLKSVSSRVTAVGAIARSFAAKKQRDKAMQLLEIELATLPSRAQDSEGGNAVYYVRLADAFFTLGDQERCTSLLQVAERLAQEINSGDTYGDWSGPERARLLARLGIVQDAIQLSVQRPGNMEGYDGLLEDVVRLLSIAGHGADVRDFIEERLDPYRRFNAKLALLNAQIDQLTIGERYEALAKFTDEALRVKDPETRSEQLAAVATIWAHLGNARRALRVSQDCLLPERLSVLNEVLLVWIS